MAAAVILLCLIVGVTDGDTVTARCNDQTLKVRLAEIDAPEKAQPFGTRSRQHLADVCFNKTAEVRAQSKERNGRTIARVICDGVDANVEQVRAGMAWVFDKYATDRGLYALQEGARIARRGLWSDSAPVAPWLWRERTQREAPETPPDG